MDKENSDLEISLNEIQEQSNHKFSALKRILHQDFRSLNFTGRFLIGLAFIVYGYSFFYYMQGNINYLPSFLPFPLFWLLLTGTLSILSGILLVAKMYVRRTSIFLATLYTIITLLVYFTEYDFQILFLNIAIIGGLLIIADSEKNTLK